MPKRILAIAASYRKHGNSDQLLDAFLQGALESGHTVEKLYLSDQNIASCRGCFACQKTGRCVIQDEILEKLQQADVVVLATPVYFYGMCGALKTFLDRTFPLYPDRQHFREAYLLAAAVENLDTTVQGTRNGVESWTRCFEKLNLSGVIFAGGAADRDAVSAHPALREAYEAGKSL